MKKNSLIILILLSSLIVISGCAKQTPPKLLQECPDEWIDNKMPCACEEPPCECGGQYLIINEERKEINQYDLDWIREKCPVNESSPVY